MEENISFSSLGANQWIVKQCASIGIKSPTPIQANCIPEILKGKHCIGAAKTGSGKTLAFALPIIQRLFEEPYGIFALVLTPTRELAYQIGDQFTLMGKSRGLKHCIIVGGMDMVAQAQELAKKPHIVIATPGRLADHLQYLEEGASVDYLNQQKDSMFSNIKYLVLDEADRLLGGDFDEQIKSIFKVLPKNRQNLLFSATITDSLEKLKAIIKGEVFLYEAPAEVATVEQLIQQYVLCPKYARDAYLVQVLRVYREKDSSGSILIFTDTCRNCQIISMVLNEVGFDNLALHAMISQKERLSALIKFRSNQVKILIATNVASRGLDIKAVQLVINHSLPDIAKEYIHRVGRTARAGRAGTAISLVTPGDEEKIKEIESLINTQLTELKVDESEVGTIFTQISLSRSSAYLKLDETKFYERRMINKRKKWISEGLDPDEEEKINQQRQNKVKRPKRVGKNKPR